MKVLYYSIFYLILTAFFIHIFVKEKELAKKIAVYRDKFSNKIIEKFKVEKEKTKETIKKVVNFTETVITAIVLVFLIQRFYIGNFKIPTGSMIPTIEVGDRIFGNMVLYKFTSPKRNDIVVFKEPIRDKVLFTKRIMALPGEEVNFVNNKLFINGKEIDLRDYSNLGIENRTWVVPKAGDELEIIPAANYTDVYKEYDIDVDKVQKELKDNSLAVNELLPNLKFILNGKETGMILDYIHDKKILNKLMNGETVKTKIKQDYFMALGDNTNNSLDSRMWGFVAENRIRGKVMLRFWPISRIGLVK
ncbi:MAG: signal peptidase I [Fusobacterium sp.]|nr:signal peptidase I [Fusobacterium sp.]